MPNLTIKNIPDEIYHRLKAAAQRHHRSMNKEVIVCLDNALPSEQAVEDEHVRRARELAAKYGVPTVPNDVIVAAIRAGRDEHD